MSFDLRIEFLGLMMWVPVSGADERMHVLLPRAKTARRAQREGGDDATHRHAEEGGSASGVLAGDGDTPHPATLMHDHHSQIVYDTAYESGARELSRHYRCVDLSDALDLSNLQTPEPLTLDLPSDIVSLVGVADPVPPELVTGTLDPRLAARVTMAKGALTNNALGGNFRWRGTYRRITYRTEWTIRGITNECEGRECLPRAISQFNRDLFPVNQTIHIKVYNSVSSEFPPRGDEYNVNAPVADAHFLPYYKLCGAGTQKQPIPRGAGKKPVTVEAACVPEERWESALGEWRTYKEEFVPGVICVQSTNAVRSGDA